MIDVSAKKTRNWWCREELHFLASIVATCQARLALVTDDVGFDGNAVAWFEVGDGGMDGEDCAGRFVT